MRIYDIKNQAVNHEVSEPLKEFLAALTAKPPAPAGERKKLKDELTAILSGGGEQAKMCHALIRKAQQGDVKAFEAVMNILGEKPVEVESDFEAVTIVDDL